jgi:hypothetical protein
VHNVSSQDKNEARNIIKTIVLDVTSQVYEDFAGTSEHPKPYLTMVGYITLHGNPDDETLSKIICGNYFGKVCSLYNIETDTTDIDNNMTSCLTILRTPDKYDPPNYTEANSAAIYYIDKNKPANEDDL